MRRRRDIPADPAKTTAETVEALGELLVGTLPSADADEIGAAIEAFKSFAFYLIPGEHLSRKPATLLAGDLACDFYTLHGDDALGAEEPSAPPGAAAAREWELFVPVSSDAPFEAADVEDADQHLKAGPAPENAGTVASREAVSLADLIDPQALQAAGGES
jgi:hypothetical protein